MWTATARVLIAYLAAVLVAAAGGSLVQTAANILELYGMDVSLAASTILAMFGHDLLRFGPAWAAIIALGFLIALPVASWIARRRPHWRPVLLPLAGACAVAAALGSMRMLLSLTAISAARDAGGFLMLCAAGALGGWVYARLSRPASAATGPDLRV